MMSRQPSCIRAELIGPNYRRLRLPIRHIGRMGTLNIFESRNCGV